MSLLIKSLQPKQILHIARIINAAQVKQCHWFPDFKPGPCPKTEEERRAAAQKYNLLPEEYEPYDDDGCGSGDYPKLPFESVDSKDPFYNFDVPQLMRDYKEPVHREMKILLPEALSTGPARIDPKEAFVQCCGFLLVCYLLFYVFSSYKLVMPLATHQVPKGDEKHYTFELDHKK